MQMELLALRVNGIYLLITALNFYGTGAWTTWSEAYVAANLVQGNNVVRATGITENGGPNVDFLTVAPTSDPVVTPVPPSGNKPTIYIAGDSTVQTYNASYYPQAGWGQMISKYFTSDVFFVNKAI